MLTDQEEQAERLETLRNDQRVREQQRGSTFHQHALAAANDTAGGRFAATGAPRVIGSQPNPSSQYPAASAHQRDPVGVEPPLGIDINAMPELEPSTSLPCSSPVVEALPDSAPAAAAS